MNTLLWQKSSLRITRLHKNIYCYLFIFAFLGCVSPLSSNYPTSQANCTFDIYNIFTACHNPANSSSPLAFNLTLSVYYFNGSERRILSSKTFVSQPGQNISEVNIITMVPTDNRTTWDYDLDIEATQCSTCALTQYGAYDICYQQTAGSGETAARPRLASTSTTYHAIPTLFIRTPAPGLVQNVPNSCGCIVPFQ